jgi:hypothetical protein
MAVRSGNADNAGSCYLPTLPDFYTSYLAKPQSLCASVPFIVAWMKRSVIRDWFPRIPLRCMRATFFYNLFLAKPQSRQEKILKIILLILFGFACYSGYPCPRPFGVCSSAVHKTVGSSFEQRGWPAQQVSHRDMAHESAPGGFVVR